MVEQSGEGATRKPNNFDALRLAAALGVLVSHAFALSYGNEQREPISRLTWGQANLGHLCVIVFFAISGWLITKSFVQSTSVSSFLKSRALRIYPGLIAVVFTTTLAAVFVSDIPAPAYFASQGTLTYPVKNLTFLMQYDLPGVFANLPWRNTVNGSLWTLGPEVLCYLAVLLVGLTVGIKRWSCLLAAVCVLIVLFTQHGKFERTIELYAPFAVASAFFVWDIPLRWWLALPAALLCTLTMHRLGHFSSAVTIGGTYLVHYVARHPSLPELPVKRWLFGDLSYGIYLWAFPVQQMVALVLLRHERWYLNAALSLLPTLGLAFLSCKLIEEPALRLKHWRKRSVYTGGKGDQSAIYSALNEVPAKSLR